MNKIKTKLADAIRIAERQRTHPKYAVALRADGRLRAYQQVIEWLEDEELFNSQQPKSISVGL